MPGGSIAHGVLFPLAAVGLGWAAEIDQSLIEQAARSIADKIAEALEELNGGRTALEEVMLQTKEDALPAVVSRYG